MKKMDELMDWYVKRGKKLRNARGWYEKLMKSEQKGLIEIVNYRLDEFLISLCDEFEVENNELPFIESKKSENNG